ncbi:MAG: F0F1 ATP synthase subunit gamma [Candidatus Nitrospinota bacterium M3_3B_026]
METIETLKRRMESVEGLKSVVRAMKTLSAVSIRQYEKAVKAVNEYYGGVELGLSAVMRKEDVRPGPSRHRGPGRLIAVVIGSDHGLCGQFNDRVVNHALKEAPGRPEPKEGGLILAVGARALAKLENAGHPPAGSIMTPSAISGVKTAARKILLTVDEWRSETGLDQVILYHNSPRGGTAYVPVRSRLAPIDLGRFLKRGGKPWPTRSLPACAMDRKQMLSILVREYLFVATFRALAESLASEHASRLAAMQAAEKNIDNHLVEITSRFRTLRQELITAELLDIVSGFEAQRRG